MIPLLVATLEGDSEILEAPDVLGRSFLGRLKRKAGNVASHQVRNVGHGVARVGRATGRVGMQLSRGNVKGAVVDLGRAVTTIATTPATMVVGAVSKSAGKKLEGVIARNDPMALLNRKIYQAVKAAIRPIVERFAGDEVALFGEDAATDPAGAAALAKQSLRSKRAAILTASAGAGGVAGAAIAGPVGAPIGAALVPTVVDELIEEIGNKLFKKSTPAPVAAPEKKGIPTILVVGGVGLAAYLIAKKG